MPVFADVLPEPGEFWYVYPTDIYTPSAGGPLFEILWFLLLWIWIALLIFWIVCLWKIFKKAGFHWRWSLIPIYREYLRFKMIWRNGWWTASLVCPGIFAVILIVSFFMVPEKFSKDKEQFWLWLLLLNPIFLWILAFDKSKYQK